MNNVNSTLSNSIEEAPEDALPDHYWVATIDVEKRTQFVLTPAVRDALRQHGSLDLVSTPRDRVSFRSSESSSETPRGVGPWCCIPLLAKMKEGLGSAVIGYEGCEGPWIHSTPQRRTRDEARALESSKPSLVEAARGAARFKRARSRVQNARPLPGNEAPSKPWGSLGPPWPSTKCDVRVPFSADKTTTLSASKELVACHGQLVSLRWRQERKASGLCLGSSPDV